MTKFVVGKDRVTVSESERYVSGTVGAYRASVTFSKDWEGLDRILIFRTQHDDDPCSERYSRVPCPSMSMTFMIPDEVFTIPARKLQVSATGSKKKKNVKVLSTPWISLGRIIPGAEIPDCPDNPDIPDVPADTRIPPGGEKDSVLAKYSDEDYDFYWMSLKDITRPGGAVAAPLKSILIWSGAIAEIPEGYSLCDGQNGTPDLRSAFVLGASDATPLGETGTTNLLLTPDPTPPTPVEPEEPTQPMSALQDDPSSSLRYYALCFIQKTSVVPGDEGTAGKSAYEIAVENGFEGTEQEWLKSLEGKSAYDIAVSGGYQGTEEEFTSSLSTIGDIPVSSGRTIHSKADFPSEGPGAYLFLNTTLEVTSTPELPATRSLNAVTFAHNFVYIDDLDPMQYILTTLNNIVYEISFRDDGSIATITESKISDGKGEKGDPGKSAYEIAVDNGYTGSETEWLATLKGEKGDPGKSAYEIAVENGFEGTKEEWLASLTGNSVYEFKTISNTVIMNVSQIPDFTGNQTYYVKEATIGSVVFNSDWVYLKKISSTKQLIIYTLDGKRVTTSYDEEGNLLSSNAVVDNAYAPGAELPFKTINTTVDKTSDFSDGDAHSYYFGSSASISTIENGVITSPLNMFAYVTDVTSGSNHLWIFDFIDNQRVVVKLDDAGNFISGDSGAVKMEAKDVTYDDATTNLGATDVQTAMEKLKGAIDSINTGGAVDENPLRVLKNLTLMSYNDFPEGFEFVNGCYRLINVKIRMGSFSNEVVYLRFAPSSQKLVCYQISGVQTSWITDGGTGQFIVEREVSAYTDSELNIPFRVLNDPTFTSVSDLTAYGINTNDVFYATNAKFKVHDAEDNIISIFGGDFFKIGWVNSMTVDIFSTGDHYHIFYDNSTENKPFLRGSKEDETTNSDFTKVADTQITSIDELKTFTQGDQCLHMIGSYFTSSTDNRNLIFANDIIYVRMNEQMKKVWVYTVDNSLTTITMNDSGSFLTMETTYESGKSAYDLAIEEGYTGTQTEWLASLKGENGKNAYQIAVDAGFVGTEAEWLLSLKGETGDSAYELAQYEGYQGTLEEWLASLKGADGKSAYQIAVDGGYQGTEEEWITSLHATFEAIDGGTFTKAENFKQYATGSTYEITSPATITAGGTSVVLNQGLLVYVSKPSGTEGGPQSFIIVTNDGRKFVIETDAAGTFTAVTELDAFEASQPSPSTYELSRSQQADAADQTETSDPIIGRWYDKRPIYRRIVRATVTFDSTTVTVTTIANAEPVAPVQGIIDGQNGSEFYTIPGYYPDLTFGVGFVKETGEVKIYGSNTSISDKSVMLYVDYVLNGDTPLPDDWDSAGTSGGTTDHTQLANRNVADQHPMSSISGLDAQLNIVPNTAISGEQIHALFN